MKKFRRLLNLLLQNLVFLQMVHFIIAGHIVLLSIECYVLRDVERVEKAKSSKTHEYNNN